jgi:hypothetical protein
VSELTKADVDAMTDEELAHKIEENRRETDRVSRSLMGMCDFAELLACGGRIESSVGGREEMMAIITSNYNTARGIATMTPSERLRTMIKHGRRVLSAVACTSGHVDFATFCTTVAASLGYGEQRDKLAIQSGGRELFEIAMRKLYSCARWAACGCNQFSLTPNLAAALMLTEVPEVEPGELQFPYPCFAISIPSGVVPFFVGKEGESRQEWADTLWVEVEGGRILWVARWRALEAHRYTSADFTTLALPGEESAPEDEITLDASMRVIRNFLLWLNAEGGMRAQRPVKVPPKLAEKRQRSGEEWPRQWEFGKSVVLAPELRRSAAEIALGRSRRHAVDGWKVRARFTVRGHWRNQAHGPGRSLRMRKWIAPFWKGPSEKEAWAHIYRNRESSPDAGDQS